MHWEEFEMWAGFIWNGEKSNCDRGCEKGETTLPSQAHTQADQSLERGYMLFEDVEVDSLKCILPLYLGKAFRYLTG